MPTDKKITAESLSSSTPTVGAVTVENSPNPPGREVRLSGEEIEALRVVLDRERTAKVVHGGLRGILSLDEEQAKHLLAVLRRATR